MRIGNYEDGVTAGTMRRASSGRSSDRSPVAAPRKRVAVLLHDAGSTNKVAQTLLEMVRGRHRRLPLDVTVFYRGAEALDPAFAARLPFGRAAPADSGRAASPTPRAPAASTTSLLFESSGMYRGEEICAAAASHLVDRPAGCGVGQPPPVGARHPGIVPAPLSSRTPWLGAISLSAATCSAWRTWSLYGRYISDTLSAVRARARRRRARPGDRSDPQAAPTTCCSRRCCGARRRSSRCRSSSSRSRRSASSGPARSRACSALGTSLNASPARSRRRPRRRRACAGTAARRRRFDRLADRSRCHGCSSSPPPDSGRASAPRYRKCSSRWPACRCSIGSLQLYRPYVSTHRADRPSRRSRCAVRRHVAARRRCRSHQCACRRRRRDARRHPARRRSSAPRSCSRRASGSPGAIRLRVHPETIAAAGGRDAGARGRMRSCCRRSRSERPIHPPRARPSGPDRARAPPPRRRRDAGGQGRATWACSRCSRARTLSDLPAYARDVRASARHRRAQLPAVHPMARRASSGR